MKDRKDDYGLAFMTLLLTVSILLTIFFGILAYATSRITLQAEIRAIEFKCLCIATCVFGVISVIFYLARLWAETLTLLKIKHNTQMKSIAVTSNEQTKDISEKSNVEKIREYKQLLDDGIITQDEFDTKKKELL